MTAGIDKATLDQTLAKTFKELRTAIDTHSEKSIELYSEALRALVELSDHERRSEG